MNDPAFRNITFDELRDTYRDATRGLIEGGADVLMIETVFDTLNAKAAIFAIEEVFDELGERLPVWISGTITDLSGRTLTGQTAGSLLAFGAPRQALRHRPQLRAGRQGTAPLYRRAGGRRRHAGQRPSQCRPAQRIRRL